MFNARAGLTAASHGTIPNMIDDMTRVEGTGTVGGVTYALDERRRVE